MSLFEAAGTEQLEIGVNALSGIIWDLLRILSMGFCIRSARCLADAAALHSSFLNGSNTGVAIAHAWYLCQLQQSFRARVVFEPATPASLSPFLYGLCALREFLSVLKVL